MYTHGEMLPAFMYPGLRRYEHLVGHCGGAWQKQKSEFAELRRRDPRDDQLRDAPLDSYKDRCSHARDGGRRWQRIETNDFAPVIEAAKRAARSKTTNQARCHVGFTTRFLSVADKIVDAVKAKTSITSS